MIQDYPGCNRSKIITGGGTSGIVADTLSATAKIVVKPILTPSHEKWLLTLNATVTNL
jgi:hypothetical protein